MDAGIVPGGDMTPEAALTKLSYVLTKNIPVKEQRKVSHMKLPSFFVIMGFFTGSCCVRYKQTDRLVNRYIAAVIGTCMCSSE